MSSPPGAMPGFSSNGCGRISARTAPPSRSSAASSAVSPIAHHGQVTSETKSIFIGMAKRPRAAQPAATSD